MPNARNRLAAPLLAALALTWAAAPARAEDPAKPADATAAADAACPDIYGVWETAYIIGSYGLYGTIDPLPPGRWWGGLLMKAYIDKDKAILVWMKDHTGHKASAVYKRFYKHEPNDYDFGGLAAGSPVVEAHIIRGIYKTSLEEYGCLLILGEYDSDAIGARTRQHLIMRKVR